MAMVLRVSGCGALGGGGLQAVEIGDGLLRLGGGGEDGAAVAFHDLEPVVDVARVVGVRLEGDADARAQEGGADLGAGSPRQQ